MSDKNLLIICSDKIIVSSSQVAQLFDISGPCCSEGNANVASDFGKNNCTLTFVPNERSNLRSITRIIQLEG